MARAQADLEELDALLALAGSGAVDGPACARMVELVEAVPGRRRAVVAALGRQRSAAAVEALLDLPEATPGVVEGVFQALRAGVRRELAGQAAPRMLALEFRSSKAKRFPAIVERARAAFGAELERLRVDETIHYRVALFEQRPARPSLAARVRERAFDLERIHGDLLRLRGVRLWINGWCFDDSGLSPKARVPLLRGWLDWAREEGRARPR